MVGKRHSWHECLLRFSTHPSGTPERLALPEPDKQPHLRPKAQPRRVHFRGVAARAITGPLVRGGLVQVDKVFRYEPFVPKRWP